MSDAPFGVLLLDKPLGLSSNAALQRVRHLLGRIKAGHAGSLDPLATGMLPICLGEATKLAGEMLSLAKAYRFGLRLGERSATGDAEGEIIERAPVPILSDADIGQALTGFIGEQLQTPPMYSALKRDGQPLYRLARQGITLEREARSIRVQTLELLGRGEEWLELRVHCSKGTYVRVLAEDIARALGTCGRLQSLRREYVEPFEHQPQHTLESLQALSREGHPWPLLPADAAVQHLPGLSLAPEAVRALVQGKTLAAGAPQPDSLWRLYDLAGVFLGLGASDEHGTLRVRRLFTHAAASLAAGP